MFLSEVNEGCREIYVFNIYAPPDTQWTLFFTTNVNKTRFLSLDFARTRGK